MTAIAAAEKKKKKDEMYYKFNACRGMGYLKSRTRKYEEAVPLLTTAIENAEPGLETPLMIARSKAYSKMVNHEAARRDALAVIDKNPKNIQGLENDAYTLYEKDNFEDSLVKNYRGFKIRKKPDYFYKGILVGKETIEDCIGRNAGPCLDHDRLGQIVVAMHMQPRHLTSGSTDLDLAKRKYEEEQIDRIFAQKYLRQLAADKQFMAECVKLPELESGNKEHNSQLVNLFSHAIANLNRQQETLMTQRPMYMFKHHEPKFSQRYERQRKKYEKTWKAGMMKIIDKMLDDATSLQKQKNIEQCLDVCERLRRFVACQPARLLSDNKREKVLDDLYTIIGQLYMDMKSLLTSWSEHDNERRIEFMLYSRIDDTRFIDRVRQTCFPKILNVKEKKRSLESRLSVSIHKMERAFLYHEISRCLLEEEALEKAFKVATAGYNLSKETKDMLWTFNNGFLVATSVFLEGNMDDSKIVFTEVINNAKKMEREDCALFVRKVIKIATEPNQLTYVPPDPVEKRENEIISMMPTPELKSRAETIIQKVTSAPFRAKLQLQQSRPSKTKGQSGRRSMKVMAPAKRRTVYEAKSSRYQAVQDLIKIDIPDIVD